MPLLSWLRVLAGRPPRKSVCPTRRRPPRLEYLEERVAPAGDLVFAQGLLNSAAGDASAQATATDGAGNAYVTGCFDTSVRLGSVTLNARGSPDAFVAKYTSAGALVWAADLGGSGASLGPSGIAVDGAGNVYTTGQLYGTANFDPGGSHTLTSAGGNNAYVSKLSASGGYVWASRLGAGADLNPGGLAVDGAGNVYTTGDFDGSGNFDPGGTHNLSSSAPIGGNAYVSKLSASGGYVWADRLGAGATAVGSGVAVDGAGNVYATGYFAGTGNFDPGAAAHNLTSSPTSFENAYASKLSASGGYVWADRLGAGATAVGKGLAVDGSGNVYTTGYFDGTGNFDPGGGSHNLSSTDNGTAYVSKLNGSGGYVWADRLGAGAFAQGSAIAVDGAGNVYTAGSFFGAGNFDPGGGSHNLTSSPAGEDNAYVSKLNPSGNYVWADRLGAGAATLATGIAADGSGNVYAAGFFQGTGNFNPGGGTSSLTSAGSGSAGFLVKLDGRFDQAITFGALSPVTYGVAPLALSATGGGSGNPVTFQVLSGPGSISGNRLTVAGAGSIVVEADQGGNLNYHAAPPVRQTLTVNRAALTIAADNKTKAAGDPLPPLTATYVGFVNGDTPASLTSQPTLSASSSDLAGVYPITASGAASPNYTITFVNGNLTVVPAAASTFAVSVVPSVVAAGTPVSVTVTAYDAYGNVATGYTGTATFSSTDGQASLPAAYPFQPADQGTQAFPATLYTAGTQLVAATDTAAGFAGSGGAVVTPLAAASFVVAGPPAVVAGSPFSVTVSAVDVYGNVATGYTGTVTLTSSDPAAPLLGSYPFGAAEAGVYTFNGLQLFTASPASVLASDGALFGSAGLTVGPAAAASLVLSGPSTFTAGVPFPVTVTAYDAYGNVATGYGGTVTFNSTDPAAALPPDYPFQPPDQGVQTFPVTLNTPGMQQVAVTDTSDPTLASTLVLM